MKKSCIVLLSVFLVIIPFFRLIAQSEGKPANNKTVKVSSSAVYDKIVFSRQESGNIWNIYIMDITGGNQTRLLSSTYKDYDPHFRYDGEKIVFGRETVSTNPVSEDIYVMNSDGSTPVNLTGEISQKCVEPKWSWDGTKIVYSLLAGVDDYDIYTMNADGTGKQALVTGTTNDVWPGFSPDGKYIVFERFIGSPANQKSKICTYSISDHTVVDLTDGSNLDEMPFYSPDGKYVIFKRGTSTTNIYKMDLSTSSLTSLTSNSIVNDAPSYSYEGTKIAWIVSSSGMSSAEIWLMNSDGTNKTQLTNNSAADFNPTFSPSTPVAPSAPAANAASSITQTGFTANWNQVTGATGYYLDVASDNGFTNFIPGYENKDAGNSASSTVTGLTAGTEYYYRVRAYKAGLSSVSSNVIQVATLPNIPAAPVAADATARTMNEFNANWNAAAGASGYRLDVALDAGFNNYLADFNDKDVSNVLTYKVTGLTANVPFYYRVRSYNIAGTSESSNVVTVQTAVAVEVSDNLPKQFFLNQCYPNPFNPSTVINYKVARGSFVTIRVYDILGREVALIVNGYKNPGSYSVTFNSSSYGLQSGVYIYSMQAGDYFSIKKMMLIK
jgi:Tol biopolymer transport system component